MSSFSDSQLPSPTTNSFSLLIPLISIWYSRVNASLSISIFSQFTNRLKLISFLHSHPFLNRSSFIAASLFSGNDVSSSQLLNVAWSDDPPDRATIPITTPITTTMTIIQMRYVQLLDVFFFLATGSSFFVFLFATRRPSFQFPLNTTWPSLYSTPVPFRFPFLHSPMYTAVSPSLAYSVPFPSLKNPVFMFPQYPPS